MPYLARSVVSFGLIFNGWPFTKKLVAINAPAIMPPAKKRFHASFFQSYLKYEIFAGATAAHICRKDDETPKVLFPNINNMGTISPINGPDMYHGQGFVIKSDIMFFNR